MLLERASWNCARRSSSSDVRIEGFNLNNDCNYCNIVICIHFAMAHPKLSWALLCHHAAVRSGFAFGVVGDAK